MYNEENAVSDAYEQEVLEKEPRANVLSKEDFEKRAENVFKTIWKILSKSFGPGGAPTIISNYPYIHTTKDGFTIAKNISMDATGRKNGRGAYICPDVKCLEKAMKSKGLERTLKAKVPEEVYEQLKAELGEING